MLAVMPLASFAVPALLVLSCARSTAIAPDDLKQWMQWARSAAQSAQTTSAPSASGRTTPPTPSTSGLQAGVYQLPVGEPVRIVRRFDAPPGPYAAGHRGVDLATVANEAVRTAGNGVVTFAGVVAGRGVVVVRHPDGLRTEYEPLAPTVRAGDSVIAGERIGVVSGQHDSCPLDGCLHWGARRGSTYIDPLGLLAPLGTVRLVPSVG